MSIYSGLPTRKDENNYNKLLTKILTLLQQHVLQLSKGSIDAKYIRQYSKIIGKMQAYEEHKYLPPKFSQYLYPLLGTTKGLTPKTQGPEIHSELQCVKEEEDEVPSMRYLKNLEESRGKIKKRESRNSIANRKSIDSDIMKEAKRCSSMWSNPNKSLKDIEWRKTVNQIELKESEKSFYQPHKTIYRQKRKGAIIGEKKYFRLQEPRAKQKRIRTEEKFAQ